MGGRGIRQCRFVFLNNNSDFLSVSKGAPDQHSQPGNVL